MENMNNFSSLITLTALCIWAQPSQGQAPVLRAGSNASFEHVLDIGSKGPGDAQFQYVEDFALNRWSLGNNPRGPA